MCDSIARHERVEQGALLLGERRAQVLGDDVLAGTVAEAPRERLRVPHADPGIPERAGVLVDAEREDGRLERGDRDLALGEDPDHRRRERAVLREHEVLGLHPVRRLAGMVVEDHDLDRGIARDALELAEALRMHRLDDDEPPDRARVDSPGLEQLQLVRMQAVELPHVSVEGARERDHRARVQAPRGEHRSERVEVRVRVRDDDVHDPRLDPDARIPPSGDASAHRPRYTVLWGSAATVFRTSRLVLTAIIAALVLVAPAATAPRRAGADLA